MDDFCSLNTHGEVQNKTHLILKNTKTIRTVVWKWMVWVYVAGLGTTPLLLISSKDTPLSTDSPSGEGGGDFLNSWIVYDGFQQNSSFITYPTKPAAQKILRLDIVYLFIIIVNKTITAVWHFNIAFILTTVLSGIIYRVKLPNVDLGKTLKFSIYLYKSAQSLNNSAKCSRPWNKF